MNNDSTSPLTKEMEQALPSPQTGTTPGSMRNAAISEIRRRIMTGEIPAEASFSEGTLCDELGMSRAPVREALVVLNQLGWVTSQPRSGYLVAAMTLNDLRDLFAIRALLEPRAAALAARNVTAGSEEAHALDHFTAHSDDPASPDWMNDHYRFHRRIAVGGLNRELDRVLSEVLLKLERYFMIAAVHAALRTDPLDHRPLATAILAGDQKAATDAAALHISQAQLIVTEAILTSDGILTAPLTPPETVRIRKRAARGGGL